MKICMLVNQGCKSVTMMLYGLSLQEKYCDVSIGRARYANISNKTEGKVRQKMFHDIQDRYRFNPTFTVLQIWIWNFKGLKGKGLQ